jgi:predicted dehydrogenase
MPYDVEDTMAMLIRFATGAQISCHFQWNIPVVRDNFELFGTEGAIISTPFSGNDLILCTSGGDIRHEFSPAPNAHLPLLEDFVGRLLAGEPPSYPAEDTLPAYQIISAAYESARTRQSVKIESEPEATL